MGGGTVSVKPASGVISSSAVSGVGIALFSSAVFGLSGSFAKSLLEAGEVLRPDAPVPGELVSGLGGDLERVGCA